METVALRIFNAYGPHQSLPLSHAPVVPRFLQQALTGGSVVLFGDGRQTRDFVYVDDVVDALISAATAGDINRSVINIGSGVETSINELVDQIEQVTGHSVNRIYNPSGAGGIPRLVADISQAKSLLKFQPKTSLQAGLSLMLAQDERFRQYTTKLIRFTDCPDCIKLIPALEQKTPRLKYRGANAQERTRTSTPVRAQALNLLRMPIPPPGLSNL